jgi:hypothetical protein
MPDTSTQLSRYLDPAPVKLVEQTPAVLGRGSPGAVYILKIAGGRPIYPTFSSRSSAWCNSPLMYVW